MPLARIDTLTLPKAPQPPPLSAALIDEITTIVFGAPSELYTQRDTGPEPGLDAGLGAEACDLIFIFGGSHPGLWTTGAAAYHAGLGKHVLVTGGYKPTATRHHTWQHGARPEALVIRDELVARGVPRDHIFVEDRSTNSLENVLFAQQVYDFATVDSILVICRSHGVGRQCRTLRGHLDPRIRVRAYPFDTNVGAAGAVVTRTNWMLTAESRADVFGHLLKIIKYGRRGDIAPLESMSAELVAVVAAWLAHC